MSIRHFSFKFLPTMGCPRSVGILARASLLASVVAVSCAPSALAAPTFEVLCNTGGDQFGYSIATNGDYNGDGINDLAVGAPCHHVGENPRAGRVLVISGANGKRLLSRRGFQTGMWLGASVSFIPDINGDGRDELAIGSPGYTVTRDDDPTVGRNGLLKAGRVDVFQRKSRRLKVLGVNANSGFGEKIAPVGDVNDDGRTDFVIAASRDQQIDGRDRPGRIYMISGRNGDVLQVIEGPKNGKRYGQTLATAGDVTGDGIDDLLVGSKDVNIFNVRRAGVVDTLNATDLESLEYRVVGAKADGVGRSIAAAGDVDGDGIPDFITGSDRSDDEGVKGAGEVTLFSSDGRRIWVAFDPELQENEEFGTAVATLSDINGDDVTDFVASATGFDVVVVDLPRDDVGRVMGLSGENGDILWSVDGEYADERFGFTLAALEDQDGDHGLDVAVGSIGDYPLGRRGAGSVKFLAGSTGELLREFAGRRGLETRIMAVAPIRLSAGRVRSFNHFGFKRELSAVVQEGVDFGDFSVTVVNDVGRPRPGVVQAAVGTGAGSPSSKVEVYSVGRKANRVDSFEAFPNLADTGVNCGAGELDGEPNENLVCVQADSEDGNVVARILRRLDEEEPFFPILEFPIFSSEDVLNNTININAGGATVAAGDVLGGSADEIVVGTTSGVPFIKVFNREGGLITSFLAYDPVLYSGVDIAIVDLDGGGEKEIVTVPRSGPALIKAFKGNGERVTFGRLQTEVSILASSLAFTGGGRVAGADVDLDTVQEIVFMRQEADGTRLVRAFERDGVEVSTDYFKPFDPFPEAQLLGGDIDGTDLFVRN